MIPGRAGQFISAAEGDATSQFICDVRLEIGLAPLESTRQRDRWLNPEGASEPELKKHTLTNLYNRRPTWLALAHKHLDAAVLDAYGWRLDLTDDQVLECTLALNLDRPTK